MLTSFLSDLYDARQKYANLVKSSVQFKAWIDELVESHPLERPYFVDMCPRIGDEINRHGRRRVMSGRGPNALVALESEQEILAIEQNDVPVVAHEEVVEQSATVELELVEVALIKSYPNNYKL